MMANRSTGDDDGSKYLAPGQRFGKYEIRERIGHGGMGVVYRAMDPALPDNRIAIKVLSLVAPDFVQRFQREAQAISRVARHSRHIVKIIDVGEVDGVPYIAMELLRGRDLESMLKA